MNVVQGSIRLVLLIEAVALTALIGTGEIHLFSVYTTIGMAILAHLYGPYRPKEGTYANLLDRLILALQVLIVAAAGWLIFRRIAHPLIVVASAVPIFHSMLWFRGNTSYNLSWRLGVSFLLVVLAGSITPEFYLAPLLFVFVLLTGLALTFLFVESELRIHHPEFLEQNLSSFLVKTGLLSTVLLLISSMIIFPILPRPSEGGLGRGFAHYETGVSEEVRLDEYRSLTDSGSNNPVLRIYFPAELKGRWDLVLPNNLIRTRALDRFDGELWAPVRRRSRSISNQVSASTSHYSLEIIREPMSSNSLPVPYGTSGVSAVQGVAGPLIQTGSSDWISIGSRQKLVHYKARVEVNQNLLKDPPLQIHTEMPRSWSFENSHLGPFAKKL